MFTQTLRTWFVILTATIAHAGRPMLAANARSLITGPGINNVRTLGQNWTDQNARDFYNTAQGSRILPYKWFLHLEQAGNTNRYLDPEHIRSLGYLARDPDNLGNPHGLPIGFVRDGESLGLTCAACHTAQINYKGDAYLIDGGPTLGDGDKLMRSLEAALRAAANAKFERFCKLVLAPGATQGDLRKELAKVIDERAGYNKRNLPGPADLKFGPGRIDAFGGILNEVAVRFANVRGNETKIDAPVSYPFLWDTPHHDVVQWNGSAPNTKCWFEWPLGTRYVGALGRNVGEVIGVFAEVDTKPDPELVKGYRSSVNKQNLIKLEDNLRGLWSPEWPSAQFGPPDPKLVKSGQALFERNCAECHQYPFSRSDKNREIKALMRNVATDETMSRNVAFREAKTGRLKGRRLLLPPFQKLRSKEKVALMLTHIGQRVVIGDNIVPDDTEVPYEIAVDVRIRTKEGDIVGSFSDLKFDNGKLVQASGRSVSVLDKGAVAMRLVALNDYEKLTTAFRGQFAKAPTVSETAVAQHIDDTAWGVMAAPERDAAIRRNTDFFRRPSGLSQTNSVVEALRNDATFGLNKWTFDFLKNPVDADNVEFTYKARPLNGIWATAPYLHNGSVPNLDELLKESQHRTNTFRLGSREFDPVRVGFRTDEGDFEFDMRAKPGTGNSNLGHDYGFGVYKQKFDEAQRAELIAFLKTL